MTKYENFGRRDFCLEATRCCVITYTLLLTLATKLWNMVLAYIALKTLKCVISLLNDGQCILVIMNIYIYTGL